MIQDNIFPAPYPWFIAEGSEDEMPCMYRGREIPESLIAHQSLPNIVVVTAPYVITDFTGLPSRTQYDDIERFERAVIDGIEQARLGVLTFSKTCNGAVRYVLYVSDIERVIEAIQAMASNVRLNIEAGEDRQWREFKSFLRGMQPT